MNGEMNSPSKDSIAVGVAMIIGTVFAMSFADAIVKYVSSDFPLWQIYVVRSLIAIPILTLIFFITTDLRIQPNKMKWTLLRSLLLTFMYIAIYGAAPLLSLSVIAATLYTGPLFITLFSSVLLKENVGAVKWIAVMLGFFGVVTIIKPSANDFSIVTLVPVVAAILYALSAILTRSKCSNEHPLVLALGLNFVLLFVGGVMTLLLFLWQPDSLTQSYPFLFGDWIAMGNNEWGILSLLAVLIVIIGIGLAKAYQSASPAIIATFDYCYLIFAAVWGYFIFADVPDSSTMLGIFLIIVSGVLVVGPVNKVKHELPRGKASL